MPYLILAIVLLVILCVVLAYRAYVTHLNLKSLRRQVQDLQQNPTSLAHLHPQGGLRAWSHLSQDLNHLMNQQRTRIRGFETREQHFKEEISNISQDLRTPLTAIKGFVDIMGQADLPESKRQEYLAVVSRKTGDIIAMVNTFYEIARMESDELPINLTRLDLGHVTIEEAVTFYHDFEARGLKVTIEETAEPLWVSADAQALRRCLHNLIQNALRYAQSRFSLSFEDTADACTLVARNDVDPDLPFDPERIFERSYIADHSRSQRATGLGLYILMLLTERQGGRVQGDLEDDIFTIRMTLPKV